MDLLIVEPLEAEVTQWLEARFAMRHAPELAKDPRALRQSLYNVRAMIAPASVTLDAQLLHHAPLLRAVGRVSAGVENIDMEACARARVEIVRGTTATAPAEAEFMVGALLSLLRHTPVQGVHGMSVGRELGSATVGLIGMAHTARWVSQMLAGFGSRLVGYDPAMHATDPTFERWQIEPLSLRDLLEQADAVCVQLSYFSRYRGLLGERLLGFCKPNQVIVSISNSALFDELSLAIALKSGRLAAAWLDSIEPGALDAGSPLHGIDTLQITSRVASTTRESRSRSSWAVAHRIDELLSIAPLASSEFKATAPGVPTDLATVSQLP